MTLVRVLLEWDVSIKAQEARMTKTPIPFDLASEHKNESIDARMTKIFLHKGTIKMWKILLMPSDQ